MRRLRKAHSLVMVMAIVQRVFGREIGELKSAGMAGEEVADTKDKWRQKIKRERERARILAERI